jgi:hypothetical protein
VSTALRALQAITLKAGKLHAGFTVPHGSAMAG